MSRCEAKNQSSDRLERSGKNTFVLREDDVAGPPLVSEAIAPLAPPIPTPFSSASEEETKKEKKASKHKKKKEHGDKKAENRDCENKRERTPIRELRPRSDDVERSAVALLQLPPDQQDGGITVRSSKRHRMSCFDHCTHHEGGKEKNAQQPQEEAIVGKVETIGKEMGAPQEQKPLLTDDDCMTEVDGSEDGPQDFIPLPLRGVLKPHQRQALQFLHTALMTPQDMTQCGAILAHSMGLGKTLTTIAFLLSLGDSLERILIVAPKNVLYHWEDEISRWDRNRELSLTKILNAKELQVALPVWKATRRSVLLVGYEMLTIFVRDHPRVQIQPYLAIFDEAHRLKNSQTLRNEVVEALTSERRLLLTGTPMQNHLAEYCCMLSVAQPGWWPQSKFRTVFEFPILNGQGPTASNEAKGQMNHAVNLLKQRLASVVHRCGPEWLQSALPPLHVKAVVLRMSLPEATAYNKALSSVKVGDLFSLRHATSTSYMKMDNIKIRATVDIIRESRAKREKVIVFSQWHAPLRLLSELLGDFALTALLTGDTPAVERAVLSTNFNDTSHPLSILLIATKAGSEGLNLVGASRVVLFDVSWNPADDAQAYARAYRYGQKNEVFVYQLVYHRTAEYLIHKQTLSKLWRFKKVVDDANPSRVFQMDKTITQGCFEPVCPQTKYVPHASVGHVVDPVLRHVVETFPHGTVLSVYTHADLLSDDLQERYQPPKISYSHNEELKRSGDDEWDVMRAHVDLRAREVLGVHTMRVRHIADVWVDFGVRHFSTIMHGKDPSLITFLTGFERTPCLVWGRLDIATRRSIQHELNFQCPLPMQLLIDGAVAWASSNTELHGKILSLAGGMESFLRTVLGEIPEEDLDLDDRSVPLPEWVLPKHNRTLTCVEILTILGVQINTDSTQWRCPVCKRGNASPFMTPCSICHWNPQPILHAHPLLLLRASIDRICDFFDSLSWHDTILDPSALTVEVATLGAEAILSSLWETIPSLVHSMMAQCGVRLVETLVDMLRRDVTWVLGKLSPEIARKLEHHLGTPMVPVAVLSRGFECWLLWRCTDDLLAVAMNVLEIVCDARSEISRQERVTMIVQNVFK